MAIILTEKPIFVIGAERSGTTLFMAMLGCHTRIAVPEVAWLYPRFRPYLYTYGDLSNDEHFRTLAEEMIFGLRIPFWGMRVNPRTIVNEIVSEVKERSFAGIYCAMFERYAREFGKKPRWGEKTPHNLFFIQEIKEDFPNAQFIFITRDGRDASADFLRSTFGPRNIFCAAEIWKLCQNAVKPWREKLSASEWMDVRYETLVRQPEKTLKHVCDFLGEEYSPVMLEFHKTDIAQQRGATRDHKPLGSPVSDRYIGIYKEYLSLWEQRVFIAVAGKELGEAGYLVDVEPVEISEKEKELYRELDGRIRAALLDAPEGHIIMESYRDWLVDQREERKRKGIWKESGILNKFPIGDPNEELIMGQRAWRKWKEYFCIKRKYYPRSVP
jgi:hypothetical protein